MGSQTHARGFGQIGALSASHGELHTAPTAELRYKAPGADTLGVPEADPLTTRIGPADNVWVVRELVVVVLHPEAGQASIDLLVVGLLGIRVLVLLVVLVVSTQARGQRRRSANKLQPTACGRRLRDATGAWPCRHLLSRSLANLGACVGASLHRNIAFRAMLHSKGMERPNNNRRNTHTHTRAEQMFARDQAESLSLGFSRCL